MRHACFGVHDLELRGTRHHNHFLLAVGVGAVHGAQVVDFDHALVLGAQLVLVGDLGRRTTHVERTQRQLRARFSNRLRGDDTHGLSDLNRTVGRKVLAVALGTHALTRLARQHGAHLHLLDAAFLNEFRDLRRNQLAFLGKHVSAFGVKHVLGQGPTFDALANALHHLVVLAKWGDGESAKGVAIFLGDDDILSHVDQTTRQVTSICRLQGRVCKTLSGTVRGDEVLQDGQAFLEV